MNAKKAKLLRKLTGYTSSNSDTVVKYEAVDGTIRPRYIPVYTTQADGTLEVTVQAHPREAQSPTVLTAGKTADGALHRTQGLTQGTHSLFVIQVNDLSTAGGQTADCQERLAPY